MVLNIIFFYILIVLWLKTDVAVAEGQRDCSTLEKHVLTMFEAYRAGNPHLTNVTHYKLEKHEKSGRWFGNDLDWFVIDNAMFTGFENAKVTGLTTQKTSEANFDLMEIRFNIPVVNFFSENYYASRFGGIKANITLFNVEVIAKGLIEAKTYDSGNVYNYWRKCTIDAIFEKHELFFEGTEADLNEKVIEETLNMLQKDLDNTTTVYKKLAMDAAHLFSDNFDQRNEFFLMNFGNFLRDIGASTPNLRVCYSDPLKFITKEKYPDKPVGERFTDREKFSKIFSFGLVILAEN